LLLSADRKTSDLIPLCHPLPLDQVNIDIQFDNGNTIVIRCECRVTHRTGVEMEALMGASVAALTIYDMTKAVSHEICIQETKLLAKVGGKRTVRNGQEERRP
jgi:cyclic pyranopterin monophosphate synthase